MSSFKKLFFLKKLYKILRVDLHIYIFYGADLVELEVFSSMILEWSEILYSGELPVDP